MKLDRTDPPRLADDETSELGRLMRLSRSRGMDATTSAKLARRLEAQGAFASGSTLGRPAFDARALFGRAASVKIAAIALVALGGALVTWRIESSEVDRSIEASGAPARGGGGDRSPPAAALDTPTVPVDALPSAVARAPAATSAPAIGGASPGAKARPRVSAAPPPTAAAAAMAEARPRDRSQAEFALIRRAQSALASDPAAALAAVEEHARTFPDGELVQEREVSAVEALASLGRKEEARTRAQGLLARFPRTPYVARLERALGEPLSAGAARTNAR